MISSRDFVKNKFLENGISANHGVSKMEEAALGLTVALFSRIGEYVDTNRISTYEEYLNEEEKIVSDLERGKTGRLIRSELHEVISRVIAEDIRPYFESKLSGGSVTRESGIDTHEADVKVYDSKGIYVLLARDGLGEFTGITTMKKYIGFQPSCSYEILENNRFKINKKIYCLEEGSDYLVEEEYLT